MQKRVRVTQTETIEWKRPVILRVSGIVVVEKCHSTLRYPAGKPRHAALLVS